MILESAERCIYLLILLSKYIIASLPIGMLSILLLIKKKKKGMLSIWEDYIDFHEFATIGFHSCIEVNLCSSNCCLNV
jgi:hypothetical protein